MRRTAATENKMAAFDTARLIESGCSDVASILFLITYIHYGYGMNIQ